MASQPLSFGELLAGGILLTMGVTGSSVRDVIAGKASHLKPVAAGRGGSSTASTSTSAWLTAEGGPPIKGASKSAEGLVKVAESQKGVQEGSAEQAQFASAAGISAAQAWCAAFVTWSLKRVGIGGLPSDPAYTGSWESWAGGEHIASLAEARPGDLLAFDKEHIGIYLGGGKMISGNWGNEVAIADVSEETEPLTAIIRVKGLYTELARSTARSVGHTLGFNGKVRA
ncbi:MAG TPA: NlpC/P60 family protein [Solirubrobacterales bacterium]|jgi:cell wall-associated NlpC family hydrolase|nr:NlpC/P60 family protein [Solirubrobacterales bacterium]